MQSRRGFIFLIPGFAALMAGESRAADAPDARVTKVQASGSGSEYTFEVTIASNDTGCTHYADWWEVVDEHGALLYRRVLLHDHADEQPFTRSGGPIALTGGQTVTVRAHMNTSGYSRAAMRGSVQSGFRVLELPADYAPELAKKQPLPDGC
jgi:hypothetical protein